MARERMRRIRWIALALALLLAGPLASGCTAGGPGAKTPEAAAALPTEALATEALPTEALLTAEPEEKAAAEATKAPKKTKAPKATKAPEPEKKAGPITDPREIADYLFKHGELPPNFITKAEAKALGWDSSRNYVSDVAPGMSIGGDRYGNYEGKLPKAKGRKFTECDVNYTGGKRNGERIVFSNDGRVWYTRDHYGTFEELFPSE